MRYIILFSVLMLSGSLFSQKMYDVKLNDCLLKFILEEELIINYSQNDSIMVQDFLSELDPKYIVRLKGVVMMQVMVDTISEVCCVSYTNKTTLNDKRLDIPNRVKSMDGWQRPQGVFENDNLCALVSILFDKRDITVIRTGYSRNKGKQMLSTSTFLRYENDSLPESKGVLDKIK